MSVVVQCMFVVSVGRLMQTVCVFIAVQCMFVVSVGQINADSLCLLSYNACVMCLLAD